MYIYICIYIYIYMCVCACFLSWSILHEIQIMGLLLLLLPLSLLFVAEDCLHCQSYDSFHHSHERWNMRLGCLGLVPLNFTLRA